MPSEPAPPGDPFPLSSHNPADALTCLSHPFSFSIIYANQALRLRCPSLSRFLCCELGLNLSSDAFCAAQMPPASAFEPCGGTLLDVVVAESQLLTDLVWKSECSSRSRRLQSLQSRRYAVPVQLLWLFSDASMRQIRRILGWLLTW